ncbi:hypothetical protein HY498_02980 [Candidatus Woesearchaeota archaeon]|nr:hypothetical protein [Candidatus Woesearchaeota archaeon]
MFTKKGAVEHEELVYGGIALVLIFIVGIGYLSFSTGETATKFRGELKGTTSDIVSQFKEVFGLKGSGIERVYGDPAANAKKAFDEVVSAFESVIKEPDKMKIMGLRKLVLLKEDYEIHVQNSKDKKVLVFLLFDKLQNKFIQKKSFKNDIGVEFGYFVGSKGGFIVSDFINFYENDLQIYYDRQGLNARILPDYVLSQKLYAPILAYTFFNYNNVAVSNLGFIFDKDTNGLLDDFIRDTNKFEITKLKTGAYPYQYRKR